MSCYRFPVLLFFLSAAYGQLPAHAPQPPAKAPAQAAPVQEGFPFTDETLHYSMNWQSGLSLGDANLTAHRGGGGWNFEVTLNAGVPGFAIADKYTSSTDTGLCSQELEREVSHGGKRTREKMTFEQKTGTARRVTLFPDGGGKSTYDIPSCARDAVAYAYYARIELGQGRVPPAQQVFFGSPYSVRMDYGGAQTIVIDQKNTIADKLNVSIKGPKSDSGFEIYYARDAARTPLRIRIPAAIGTFTLELVR
jgi:Protein of unknown function (DUF3108)